MSATLMVRDETAFKLGNNDYIFPLSFPTERITVRELIRERVFQEVQDYNLRQPEFYCGLVKPSDAEQTLNGFRLTKKQLIDWEQQFDKALEAFERNGFIILVGNRQVEGLDEVIEIEPESSVTFLKLVPLVGG